MVSFLIGAFGITWFAELILILFSRVGILGKTAGLFEIIMTIAVFGPGMGAYFAWKKEGTINGFKTYIKKEIGDQGWKKASVTVAVMMIVMLLVSFVFFERTTEKWYMFLIYIPYMIFGGGFEELGWRGYLHPYLKKKYDFPVSVLLVGIIWSVWHLPLWLVSGTSQSSEDFGCFLVFCLCLAMILAVVYEITENVMACIFIHAWSNVLFSMFYFNLDALETKTVLPFIIMATLSYTGYILLDRRNRREEKQIEFLSKKDAISVLKSNGTNVDYFLFDEYEIHLNQINANTEQEWHYHTKIEETLLITKGILGCKWLEKSEPGKTIQRTKYLKVGEMVRVGNSVHTFFNDTNEVATFTVFRFVPTGENKRELIKKDKTVVKQVNN